MALHFDMCSWSKSRPARRTDESSQFKFKTRNVNVRCLQLYVELIIRVVSCLHTHINSSP